MAPNSWDTCIAFTLNRPQFQCAVGNTLQLNAVDGQTEGWTDHRIVYIIRSLCCMSLCIKMVMVHVSLWQLAFMEDAEPCIHQKLK
jgi:hypothetical protein